MSPSVSMMKRVVWDTADKFLRNNTEASTYGDHILPFVTLRRMECLLEDKREEIVSHLEEKKYPNETMRDTVVKTQFEVPFYTSSRLTMASIAEGKDTVEAAMKEYLDSFDEPIRDIWDSFEFKRTIKNLDKVGQLWNMVDYFGGLDLHPEKVDNEDMGALFEHLMYMAFSNSAKDAGEFYTPRDVIELMVDIVFDSDDTGLRGKAPARSIYDPTAGTAGMLLIGKRALEDLNPNIDVTLYGQEKMPKSWAIGSADLLIQGERPGAIAYGNTLEDDLYAGQTFDYILANPPYGSDWKSSQSVVKAEAERTGSRFSHGLPATSDGQMLFLSHIIHKLTPSDGKTGGGRGAVVMNGSPLFTGEPESGPDSIRAWLLDNDFVDAIIALPTQMFFNTDIATYVWIVDRNKEPKRRGKVQLINATDVYSEMKSLGKKRRELSDTDQKKILDIYKGFEDSEFSRIVTADELSFLDVPIRRPLRLEVSVTDETVAQALDHADITDEHRAAIESLDGLAFNDVWKVLAKELRARKLKNTARVRKHIALSIAVPSDDAPVSVDEKGVPLTDPDFGVVERIPFTEDVDEHMAREVLPFEPNAIWDIDSAKKGYEIPISRIFYKPQETRTVDEIDANIERLIQDLSAQFQEVKE